MRELKVYLFRHGQSTYNKARRFTGWHDPLLTVQGKRDARKIAKILKGKRIDVAIYTRLRRSKETLKEVLKFHPECKKLLVDDRMIERNYGKLNGVSHDKFIEDIGKRVFRLDVQGDAIENLSRENRKKLEKFLGTHEFDLIHRGYKIPPPGGESFAMVEKRVASFIRDLRKMMKREKVNVAISAHGNSVRLFRKIMENASVDEMTKWFIPYDKVFVYKVRV